MAETLEILPIPIPNLLLFFTFFSVVYLTGYFAVFRRWSPLHRPDATSCFISLFHGSPAAILALLSLLKSVHSFTALNSPFQSLTLDFSIAYFIADLLHLTVFPNGRYLFIAHHIATLFVFITCRYVTYHGAFALTVLLFLAEVTSLMQNVWTLAGIRRKDLRVAGKVYRVVSVPFYGMYTVMRVVVGPVFFAKMCVVYLSGEAEGVIPRWVAVSWCVVVGGAIAVSILWIWARWVEFFVEGREMKKER